MTATRTIPTPARQKTTGRAPVRNLRRLSKELARNNALDFDDLILMFTDLMQQNANVRERIQRRFRHVMVDEFQDTNKSQSDLISLITKVDSPSIIWAETKTCHWPRRGASAVDGGGRR